MRATVVLWLCCGCAVVVLCLLLERSEGPKRLKSRRQMCLTDSELYTDKIGHRSFEAGHRKMRTKFF